MLLLNHWFHPQTKPASHYEIIEYKIKMLSGLFFCFIIFLFTHALMRKGFIPRIAGYENDCIVFFLKEKVLVFKRLFQ